MNSITLHEHGLKFTIDGVVHYLPRDAFDHNLKVQQHPCEDVLVFCGEGWLRERNEPEPDYHPKQENLATGRCYPSSTGQAIVAHIFKRDGYVWAYAPWVQQVYSGRREMAPLYSIKNESELPDYVNAATEVRA